MATKRSKRSAGLLMYRRREGQLEVFLAHPGGPFFVGRDEGVWTIPKGEIDTGENPLEAAQREFTEETGLVSTGEYLPLGVIQQRGGKLVEAWAFAGDYDGHEPLRSNTFTLEWPPGSGKLQVFPEVDRVAFFDLPTARRKLNTAQVQLLDELVRLLAAS